MPGPPEVSLVMHPHASQSGENGTADIAATFDLHEAPTLTGRRRGLGTGPLVLVVDDAPDARDLYAMCLDYLGYRTATATSGVRAVQAALDLLPTAILMDVAMPGDIDGIEATRRIKADPRTRHCLVVVVTAHGASKFGKARTAGCDAYFCKPFNAFALDRVLRMLTTPEERPPRPPTPVVKRCGCGEEYALEKWLRLPLCGRMHSPHTGLTVELRNCRCGSSLALSEDEMGDVAD